MVVSVYPVCCYCMVFYSQDIAWKLILIRFACCSLRHGLRQGVLINWASSQGQRAWSRGVGEAARRPITASALIEVRGPPAARRPPAQAGHESDGNIISVQELEYICAYICI